MRNGKCQQRAVYVLGNSHINNSTDNHLIAFGITLFVISAKCEIGVVSVHYRRTIMIL